MPILAHTPAITEKDEAVLRGVLGPARREPVGAHAMRAAAQALSREAGYPRGRDDRTRVRRDDGDGFASEHVDRFCRYFG